MCIRDRNLKLKNLNVDADNNITFEITKDSTLEIEENLDIKGKVAVKGEGMLADVYKRQSMMTLSVFTCAERCLVSVD